MKRTPLRRVTTLKAKTPLKRTRRLKPVSVKTLERNGRWRIICVERAQYLINTYGKLVCEYSGETIRNLTSVVDDPDDGWGHHLDGHRDNCQISNCAILKYRHHQLVHDNNLKITQEWFAREKNAKDEN